MTLVQDIATTVDEHWRLFMDEEFDRKQYLEGFGFPKYELLEHKDDEQRSTRKIRVQPKLDVPAAVAKILGDKFGYKEHGRFDRKTRLRSRRAAEFVADEDPIVAAIARGVVQHHIDDGWFHATPAFNELSLQFAVEIRELLNPLSLLKKTVIGFSYLNISMRCCN